ncbi:hypothetical protein GH714_026469 [Hevea brasiliensis]|uniref:Cytochrome P450 n=1 Tax=Hevea brasiliensis TaxID=3981 RepID=A0A6A6N7T5_HEVBR|nr:hypothetical protein GH714_026469 [Hevea brasiliensis]
MFFAWSETTSAATEWAMAELLRKPEAMRKVKEELNEVVGENRNVEESDIEKLPYLQAVVKEALRLHPSVPLLVQEKHNARYKFHGTVVLLNSSLLVCVFFKIVLFILVQDAAKKIKQLTMLIPMLSKISSWFKSWKLSHVQSGSFISILSKAFSSERPKTSISPSKSSATESQLPPNEGQEENPANATFKFATCVIAAKRHAATRLPFVDAFLLKMKKEKVLLANKKIWSHRSVIIPEFGVTQYEFTMEEHLFITHEAEVSLE